MITCNKVDYITWLNELRNVAHFKYGYPANFNFDYEIWRPSYDNGLTPDEAADLEMSYIEILKDTLDCKVLD